MKIGIVRHAKVIYRYRYFTTGITFTEGSNAYDKAEIEITKLEIKAEDFAICYASSQPRAVQTAKMIFKGKTIITDELIEVPMASYFLSKFNLPTLMRKIFSRIAWYLNFKMMPETRKQSTDRAKEFLHNLLSENHQDTLLVTHGFFIHCLKRELKKHGFKGYIPLFPKNACLYLVEKKEAFERLH